MKKLLRCLFFLTMSAYPAANCGLYLSERGFSISYGERGKDREASVFQDSAGADPVVRILYRIEERPEYGPGRFVVVKYSYLAKNLENRQRVYQSALNHIKDSETPIQAIIVDDDE